MCIRDRFHDECAVFGIYGHKEAANLGERIDDPVQQRIRPRMGDEMDNDFRVGRRLKNSAIGFQFTAKHGGIDQIPIVRHGEVTEGKIDAQGLHILEACPARSGIAVVPDRHRAGQTCQGLLRKNICNKALTLFDIRCV